MAFDYTKKNGNKRHYNYLASLNMAVESVPAGRMDSEIRVIGLDNLVNNTLRKRDRVESHVRERAIVIGQIDSALKTYADSLADGYDSAKTSKLLDYMKEVSSSDVEKVKSIDLKFLGEKFVEWKTANYRFHRSRSDAVVFSDYSNSTKLFKRYLTAFAEVHGDIPCVNNMIREFNDLRKD